MAAQQDRRPLTARQRQVLDRVVRGLGNKAIAADLGISEQAAKEHVSTLLRRFGATGRAALAEIGTQLHIMGVADADTSWLPYLFMAAPIGMQVFRGPDHLVVATNETARKAADRDVIGLPLREGYPLTADRIGPMLDQVLVTAERHVEYEFGGTWVRDGQMQASYSDFVLQPIKTSDGTVTDVVLFGSDVTERVLAQRRAERLSAEQLAVFDLMQEGVIVSDARGNLLKVNEAGTRLTGLSGTNGDRLDANNRPYKLRDATGQPVPFAEVPLVRALSGEIVPWTAYILFNPVRGADVRVRLTATPIRSADGTIIGGVVVYRPARAE
jgi:DNA-binding CsgD family transcriptional regulator/PAS domain-containing protein